MENERVQRVLDAVRKWRRVANITAFVEACNLANAIDAHDASEPRYVVDADEDVIRDQYGNAVAGTYGGKQERLALAERIAAALNREGKC